MLEKKYEKVRRELVATRAMVARLSHHSHASKALSERQLLGAVRRIEYLVMERDSLRAEMAGKDQYLNQVEAFIMAHHEEEMVIGGNNHDKNTTTLLLSSALPPPPVAPDHPVQPRVKGTPLLGPPLRKNKTPGSSGRKGKTGGGGSGWNHTTTPTTTRRGNHTTTTPTPTRLHASPTTRLRAATAGMTRPASRVSTLPKASVIQLHTTM